MKIGRYEFQSADPRLASLLSVGLVLRIALAFFFPLNQRASKRVNVAIFIEQTNALPLNELSANIPFSYPPLWHFLLSIPMRLYDGLVGVHRLYFLLTPVFGLLTIWLTYRMTERLYGERIAFLAAAILTFHPYFLRKNLVPSIETFITFTFVLSIYFYILYLDEKDKKYLFLTFLSAGVGSLTKVFGPALFLIISAHYVRNREFGDILTAVGYASIGGLVGSSWYIRNIYRFGHPYPRDFPNAYESVPITQTVQVQTEGALSQVPRMVFEYMGLFGLLNPIKQRLPGVFFLLAISGLVVVVVLSYGYYLDRSRNRYADLFTIWIGFFVILLAAGTLFGVSIRPKWRHLTTLTPYTAILIAHSYTHVVEKAKFRKVARVVLVAVLVVSVVQIAALTTIKHSQFQSESQPVMEYIEDTASPDDRVLTRRPAQFGAYTARPTSYVTQSKYMPWRNINNETSLGCQLQTKTDYLVLEPEAKSFHQQIYNYTKRSDEFEHVKTFKPKSSTLNPSTLKWVIVKNVDGRSDRC